MYNIRMFLFRHCLPDSEETSQQPHMGEDSHGKPHHYTILYRAPAKDLVYKPLKSRSVELLIW